MKTIYNSIYIIGACLFMGLLFSCTNDEFEKEQSIDSAALKVVVNATMIGYEGEDGQATKLTDGGSWQTGDVIYMCVGSEENSFTLTYQGSGQWKLAEWLDGDMNKAFAESSGKLTALYCSNAKDWKRENGKITGETNGDIVYTKNGEYKLANDVIYFNINLDMRPVSKLVIKDVDRNLFPAGSVKGYHYLSQLHDLKWNNKGTTGMTYQYDSSTKELKVWGFWDADNVEVMLIHSSFKYFYKRAYAGKKLKVGQMVTISGPLGDEANQWKKYDKEGNIIKTATIHYGKYKYVRVGVVTRKRLEMQGELPNDYSMVAGDSIVIRVMDQDGKAIKLGDGGVSFSFNQSSPVVFSYLNDTTAVLFANASGTPTLKATMPSGYSTGEITRTFNLTRDANKPILFCKQDDTWKELGYRSMVNLNGSHIFKIVYKGKDVIIARRNSLSEPNVNIFSDNTDVVSVRYILGDDSQTETFSLNYLTIGTAKVTVSMLKEKNSPEDVFEFKVIRRRTLR